MKFLPLLLIVRRMHVSQRAGQFWFENSTHQSQASLVAQTLRNLPAVQETQVRSLGCEDPLEKEMATHSSVLAWEIPWMEAQGVANRWTRLNDWHTHAHTHTHTRTTQGLNTWRPQCLFTTFFLHLNLPSMEAFTTSFHKPLLKNYYVKFIGRIFMKGRVLLLKEVSVFIMWLHHLIRCFWVAAVSSSWAGLIRNSPSIGVVLAQPKMSPSEQQGCGETQHLSSKQLTTL